MPGIPIYQQQTTVGGSFDPGRASPDAFGGQVAGALGNVGAAGQRVGEVQTVLLRQQEERDAKSWSGTAVSKAMLDWTETMQKRQQAALPGAPDFTPGVLHDFDEYASKVVDSAPTPAAKEFISSHMTQMRTSIGEQALHFEGAAKVNLRLDNAQASIENSAKVVQQDPGKYDSMMSLIRNTMPEVGPELQKKLNDKAIATMTSAAASHALEIDPYGLREVTGQALGVNGFTGKTGIPWIDDASPEHIKQWNNAADVKIKQLEAGKARDQDASAKLAVDAVDKLRTFVTDGLVPDIDYQNEVRMLTRDTPWAEQANALIEAGIKGAGFGSQTIPRQRQLLQELQGQPTDPVRAKEIEHAQTVHNNQVEAFKKDAWDAGSRYQRLPAVPEVQISDASQLVQIAQQRVLLMNRLEASSGAPAPLLHPAEVPQAIAALNKMDPGSRARVLGQVGAGLSAERINAFADQLDKGDRPLALTLKLGTDQTTAGRMVSELVQRGAQGLKDKTIKREDQALQGWRYEIASLVRGSLGDSQAESDVIDAAYYVRAAMDQGDIDVPGFKLASTAEQAVKLVIGQPIERNGVKTLLPRGMSEDAFDKALEAYTPDRLKEMAPDGVVYLRGQPVQLQRFSDSMTRYGVQRDGQGNFLPSASGAFITTDKEGRNPIRLKVLP